MLARNQKLAIYMDGAVLGIGGKMGFGILRYSPNPIACIIDSETVGRNIVELTGIPRECPIVATVEEARELGAEVLVLGIAPPGGKIPEPWYPVIDEAVAAGMSLVNGLHDLLGPSYPALPFAGQRQFVWDIRVEPADLSPGNGLAASLPNRRVLLIGTDMAVGKMTAGLEVHRVARERGIRSEFVATGQIGITITGAGIPLDAIRVDFASGAVEREVMRFRDAELVIVEGQGALIHPGSTANLPLLRGSCPTELILCVRAGQTALRTHPEIAIPPLGNYIRLYEDLAEACGTFPRPRTAAVAVNSAGLTSEEADRYVEELEKELGLPCADPVRHGPERLLDAVLSAI